MGLHWAKEGTVAMRLHNLTRHKVFAGPAVQITMDVSEAANGGQILLTEVRTLLAHGALRVNVNICMLFTRFLTVNCAVSCRML